MSLVLTFISYPLNFCLSAKYLREILGNNQINTVHLNLKGYLDYIEGPGEGGMVRWRK